VSGEPSWAEEVSEVITRFVGKNGIREYDSAHRAYKFAVKRILHTARGLEEDGDGGLRLERVVTIEELHRLYKRHLSFFIALDTVEVRTSEWVLMQLTEGAVFLLLRNFGDRRMELLVDEIAKAMERASRADWRGRVFYKVIGRGGQREVLMKKKGSE
jgi:hypothetical protein